MKKILAAFMAAAMLCTSAIAFAGCGSSETAAETGSNTKTITTADDLKGAVIGVQLGTTGDIFASDYEEDGSTIERYNKGADAVAALVNGKIDCVMIDSEPAKAFVAANEGLKILDEPFAEEEYAICVSLDNTDLLDKMNGALNELKSDGTLQKIVDNFIGDDTKGKSAYTTPDGTKYPNGELHMATNAEFEPYEYVEGGEVVGIDPMTAQAICDKLGYKLVIDNMDFDAVIGAVQSGKADFGMAGMTVTDERKKSVNFTDTYATTTQVIIVKE